MGKLLNIPACTRCRLGIEVLPNHQLVVGEGNTHAEIMIIGEAPNENAAISGKAFRGGEGDTLKELLRLSGIDPNSVYVTYACKCRSWKWQEAEKNRGERRIVNCQPERDEVKACSLYLQQEIRQIRPKVIIALGSGALSALEGRVCKITERRGITSIYKGIKDKTNRTYIMPTLQPSYINMNGGVRTHMGMTDIANQVVDDLKYAANMRNNPELFKEHRYITVDSREKLNKVIAVIKNRKVCAFDIETTGLDFNDRILGVGFSPEIGTACYIPFLVRPDLGSGLVEYWADKDITRDEVVAGLAIILEDPDIMKIAHNAKFDMRCLRKQLGITVKGLRWDTMSGAYLIDENSSHKLKELKNRFIDLLGYEDQWNSETQGGENSEKASFETIVNYCCGDCDATYRLAMEQQKLFNKNPTFMWFMQNFYVPLHHIITDMEYHGVLYDVARAIPMSEEYRLKAEAVKKEAAQYAGCNFDPESPQQVQKILFSVLGLKHDKLTKTKMQAVDKKVLTDLADKHPVPRLIIEYRHINKMRSTYIEGFRQSVDENNRLHISINPIGTVTGRMSSEGLMNIPREEGIKSLIIAPPGHKLVCADLSQAEVRCFAHYANEDVLRSAYAGNKIDVHCLVAAEVLNIPFDEFMAGYEIEQANKTGGKYSDMRQAAKGCLRPDMRVMSNHGLLAIKDFGVNDRQGFVEHKRPTKVLGLAGTMVESDKAFNNGPDDGVAVTTELGYEFSGTPDHKIQVLCPDGQIQDKRLRDVTKDDYAVLRINHPDMREEVVGCDEEILRTMVLSEPENAKQLALYKPWEPPKKLTYEWGWFIGFLIGEGTFYSTSIKWDQKDTKAFEYEIKTAKKLLPGIHIGISTGKNYGRDINIAVISNYQIRDFFRKIGIADGFYDKEKRQKSCHLLDVPEIIFKSSYDVMQGFLQGLWAGDGSIVRSKNSNQVNIKLGLSAERLIKNTQLLMSYFGVLTYRYKEYNKKYKRYYFYLKVADRISKENFLHNIGFVGENVRQQKLISALAETQSANDSISIPYQEKILNNLYHTLPPTNRASNQRWKDNVQVRIKRKIDLTSGILNSLPTQYTADIDSRFFGDFYFDRIREIKKEKFDYSYDLSVPNGNHYSAQNYLTHNTVFGLLYGRGPASIALEYKMTYEQAVSFSTKFFARFANCKKWIDATHAQVRQTGEVVNIFGRIRRIPTIRSSNQELVAEALRQAVNSIIQSTASDINNLALIAVYNAIHQENIPAHILFTVYDSIIIETPDEHIPHVKTLLRDVMERKPHPDFSVKIRADLDVYVAYGAKDKKK